MSRNTFVLNIPRALYHPKSFGTFEKRAPGFFQEMIFPRQFLQVLIISFISARVTKEQRMDNHLHRHWLKKVVIYLFPFPKPREINAWRWKVMVREKWIFRHFSISIWLRKYARIFVLGHYLFREANSFPRPNLEENCSLLGTDNNRGQISEHIFAQNEGYCLYNLWWCLRNSKQINSITTTYKIVLQTSEVISNYIQNSTVKYDGTRILPNKLIVITNNIIWPMMMPP